MTYLVDSDWVADYLKGKTEALVLLQSLEAEGLAISIITYGEIYEAIFYGPNPRSHAAGFRQFLRGVTVVPLARQTMQHFARIRGKLRRTGQLIGDPIF